jgi:hypothetical protein
MKLGSCLKTKHGNVSIYVRIRPSPVTHQGSHHNATPSSWGGWRSWTVTRYFVHVKNLDRCVRNGCSSTRLCTQQKPSPASLIAGWLHVRDKGYLGRQDCHIRQPCLGFLEEGRDPFWARPGLGHVTRDTRYGWIMELHGHQLI